MAPFGVWLPWREVVTLALGHGFTEQLCFECADTWLQLDALEFDPEKVWWWDPGCRCATDPFAVPAWPAWWRGRGGCFLGWGCCSCTALVRSAMFSEMADRDLATECRGGSGASVARASGFAWCPASWRSIWHLYSQYLLDQQSRTHNLAPDIPQWEWAWDLFSVRGFQWTTARVEACQQSLLADLQVDMNNDMEEEPDNHIGRGHAAAWEWHASALTSQVGQMHVADLKKPRRRCPRSRKKPPKHGLVRHRPAAKKAPHQKPKKGFLQLQGRQVQKKPSARSVKKKPAARVYTPDHQRTWKTDHCARQAVSHRRRSSPSKICKLCLKRWHWSCSALVSCLTEKFLLSVDVRFRSLSTRWGAKDVKTKHVTSGYFTLDKHPIFAQRGTSFPWKT